MTRRQVLDDTLVAFPNPNPCVPHTPHQQPKQARILNPWIRLLQLIFTAQGVLAKEGRISYIQQPGFSPRCPSMDSFMRPSYYCRSCMVGWPVFKHLEVGDPHLSGKVGILLGLPRTTNGQW